MKSKKAAFDVINSGMIAFVGFVLITLLAIVLVSQIRGSSIVQGDSFNVSNTGTYTNTYNATTDMQNAAALPPQFAQIVVITLIIVGILGMLAGLAYVGYQKFKN